MTRPACIAFDGDRLLAQGALADVAIAVRQRTHQPEPNEICIFDYATSHTIEFDLRGSEAEMLARIQAAPPTGLPHSSPPKSTTPTPPAKRRPGRPRLGVISREITLLPRHWDWLSAQPGGASVTLRKLVEDARRTATRTGSRADLKAAREIAYRFMTRMAGDRENFEEASRALFAGDAEHFNHLTETWPSDIYQHLQRLAASAFAEAPPTD